MKTLRDYYLRARKEEKRKAAAAPKAGVAPKGKEGASKKGAAKAAAYESTALKAAKEQWQADLNTKIKALQTRARIGRPA